MEHSGEWVLETAVNDFNTPDTVLWELHEHLGKTQNQDSAKEQGLPPPETRLVSLSDDFPWAVQRICRVGRGTMKAKVPGLAIFDTAKIEPAGSHVFRVGDLLEYLDESPWRDAINISEKHRKWASNCGEYVCWSLIPKAALVAFVPLSTLRQEGSLSEPFLRPKFTQSMYLGSFRQEEKEYVTHEEYIQRVSRFLVAILGCVRQQYDVEQLDAKKLHFDWFVMSARDFGYHIRTLDENGLLNIIKTELRREAERRRPRRVIISSDSEEDDRPAQRPKTRKVIIEPDSDEDIGTGLAALSI